MATKPARIRWLLALLTAALAAAARGTAADADALPAGAVARLGTARFANVGRVMALAFSPDGKTLAAGSWDGEIRLWDVTSQKETKRLSGHDDIVRFLAFSPDGRRLVSAGPHNPVRVWDVAAGREIRTGDRSKIRGMPTLSSPDGTTLAVQKVKKNWNDPTTLYVWDLASLRELGSLTIKPFAWPLGLAHDGKRLAVYQPRVQQETELVQILDVASGKELGRPVRVPGWVRAAAFSPDGRLLAVTVGGTLRLWDLRAGREYRPYPKEGDGGDRTASYGESSSCLTFSADGKSFAAGGGDHVIHVWETTTARERCRFESPITGEVCVAIAPDGRTLASGSLDLTVLLWDLTGRHGPGAAQADPRPDELPALWDALESTDAARAYRALWRLAAAGDRGVAYAAGRLQPVRAADSERVKRLLTDLDDGQYSVREKASRELEALGESAAPFVQAKLAGRSPSLEARRRLERLLEKLAEPTPHSLRELRAVELLERVGTPQARQVLQSLTKGVPEARLTQDARAALDRCAKLPATHRPDTGGAKNP